MKSLSCLALVLAATLEVVFGAEPNPEIADAQAQHKLNLLLQAVIQHWNGSNPSNSFGVAGIGIYTNVVPAFRDAVKLMPARLDLRYGLASSLWAQATQTNGLALTALINEALEVYQNIHTLAPGGSEAILWRAACFRAMGRTNLYEAELGKLAAAYPQQARDYDGKFCLAENVLQMVPTVTPHKIMPDERTHAIVVFGAALETNGMMKVKLISRLQQGYKLARIYHKAPIILSGGNARGGVTEAYTMSLWYLRKGISRQRLFLEDQARDTVGNAMHSAAILQKLGVTHVTLVTSSSHLRRALVDLIEACSQRGLHLQYDFLAASSPSDPVLDPVQERLGVFRDLLRASGMWAYPGLQR